MAHLNLTPLGNQDEKERKTSLRVLLEAVRLPYGNTKRGERIRASSAKCRPFETLTFLVTTALQLFYVRGWIRLSPCGYGVTCVWDVGPHEVA